VCVCVTPEPSTERKMSHVPRVAEEALEELGAGGALGGGAAGALMTLGAGAVAASGGHPGVALAVLGIGITYVLW
jgi:hypothetical protein